jgi:hypothetical protein
MKPALSLQRLLRGALVLVLADLGAVVVSGGVSLLGPTEAPGFFQRVALAAVLVVADFPSLSTSTSI